MKIGASNGRLPPSSFSPAPGQAAVPLDATWKQSLDDPDETRAFARLVRRAVEHIEPCCVLDVGCGSGIPTIAAAVTAASCVLGIDLIPSNVFHARQNIRAAGLEACVTAHVASWEDVLTGTFYPGAVDLVVSNPPYVPAGDGSAVDGGPKGTRLLFSILDGLPRTGRGVALLLGSLSDPLHVLARVEQRGYRVSHLFAESVPFGRYTSAPRTLAALERLRTGGSAWFFDTAAIRQPGADPLSAPYAYLRLGVIAERRVRPEDSGVRPSQAQRPARRAGRLEARRTMARLLETYQRGGPSALADFLRTDASQQRVEPL